MILSKQLLVLLSSLLCSQNTDASRLRPIQRASVRHAHDVGELHCRVTIKETTFDDGNGGIQDEDDVVCIKQVGEEDSSTILSLVDLPSHVYEANEKEIALGRLYISLTGISVDGGNVIISDKTEFTVMENNGSRKLEEEHTRGDLLPSFESRHAMLKSQPLPMNFEKLFLPRARMSPISCHSSGKCPLDS
jgi:hypothetical protein